MATLPLQALPLQTVFVEALGIPADTEFANLEYGKDPLWDSLAHMQLVAAIEKAYDIMLETDDVIGLSSYLIAVEILKKKYGIDL
jgi:acyl carrier protein